MVGNEWQRKQGSPEVRVMEECGEIVQAVTKALRFRWEDWRPKQGQYNREHVVEEVKDLTFHWNELAEKESFPYLALRDRGDTLKQGLKNSLKTGSVAGNKGHNWSRGEERFAGSVDKRGTPEVRVMEECGKIVQAVAKALRFGWEDNHPEFGRYNRDNVVEKVRDLVFHWNELAGKEGFPHLVLQEGGDESK